MKKQAVVRTRIDSKYRVGKLRKLLQNGYTVVVSNIINRGNIVAEYIVEKETQTVAMYCEECKHYTVHNVHILEGAKTLAVCIECGTPHSNRRM